MIENATVEIISAWPIIGGWYTSPSGNRVKLGNGVTGDQLNRDAIAAYAEAASEHVFWKWLTPDRKSPNWHDGTEIEYPAGATIEADSAEVSDQQCGAGLHVFRIGQRPEWYGLKNSDLINVRVLVRSEDILFAGIATMDAKLRVRRLTVLD